MNKVIIAALAGLFVANFAAPVLAQGAGRDAAIHKCILQAQTMHPDISNPSNQRNRTDAYRSCMQAEGQRP